ncbi:MULTISPECIES: TRAP transporter large permease [unclassified Halomonas]|uniref:TRAP transporter large permease n=1 Tax=unclassified Halomonas TaxID=2609666 RepID=UPI001C95198F|nr:MULTISPECIES: TRAP transporter large permease [unclassified Halomonas]MBY5925166.1 TRAP transporter large permease [Halomonas sp. DP4Y7-2]MBY6232207.1 TRAP transporter large permease [Halomonas sp. DP4Y7-1]
MMTIAAILLGLVVLLFTGLPIFAGLSIFGGGLLLASGAGIEGISEIIFHKISLYVLLAIPLFAYMAHIMIRARIIDDLYATAYTLTRHLPGGVGVATILACMIFSAISGSSVATALTIGAVAIPQMIRYGYDPRVAYGLVAAGGTLGILIPPSGPMIIYGVATDTSIGGLFMAGLVPGLMLALIFMLSTAFQQRHCRREPRAGLGEVLRALRASCWALALPALVLGGMYVGVFTATEAAAVGALLALAVGGLIYRTIGPRQIWASAIDASRTSAMLFMILAGAAVFSHALTKLLIPQQIVSLVSTMELGTFGFLLMMMALIFVLGMFLESIAIILITSPVVLPVLALLEISPIWYGVMLVINLELAMITPPVGMNLFTIKAVTEAPIGQIIRGSLPFVLLMLLGLALVMVFPGLALWLPGTMLELGP